MKRWLIPVFFMMLAALACDQPYYDPPRVFGVNADDQTAGRVYALVGGNADLNTTYQSDDYGRTWQLTDTEIEADRSDYITMENETLYANDLPIWSFPRPVYRFFFLDDKYGRDFVLPNWGHVSSSEANGVLYVAMGTQGVLAFTAPEEWFLSAEGIDVLNPLPLTITKPEVLLAIVALALLVPPLPLIHAYLLSRVWIYVLPAGKAWSAALKASFLLAVLAAIAIVIWLTDARTDFYGIVAVMSAVTVFVAVGTTLVVVPEEQSRHLLWRIVLVSLIVPLGVASVFVGWLFILPLVTAYFIYRTIYSRLLRHAEAVTPGFLDRLTFGSMGVIVACMITIFIISALVARFTRIWLPGELILVALAVACYWSIRRILYVTEHRLIKAKLPTESLGKWVSTATVLCYAVPLILAGLVFSGQATAYNWFTTLLVPR